MNIKESAKKENFLLQGSILAFAGIIVRLIGLIYRVPLTNIIGNSGIGVYSTAYSIYNILLVISSYTLPLAVSKLIAERLATNEYKNSRRLLIGSCVFALFSGGVMGSLCYFGAGLFADVMNMPQAEFAIQTMAPTIFIMAFLGVLRGYFQGHNTMVPTALSQIFEQIVNAIVSIVAGALLFDVGLSIDMSNGTSNYTSASYGAAGGTIGTGAGALAAFVFCLIVYLSQRKKFNQKISLDKTEVTEKYGYIMKIIVMTIFPVLISTTIFQISTVIDQAIYAQYMKVDYSNIWGAYSGKYTLLVNLPVSIASSLGAAVIPALAAAMKRGNKSEIVAKSGTAIRFNMVIAIPATVGLAVLAEPAFNMLFSTENDLAIQMMMVGSSAILFTALSTIMNSILQGIGNIWLPVKNAVIALGAHVAILAIFLWVFDFGIYGVIFANILFYVFMCYLNYRSMRKRLDYKQEIAKTFVSPLVSSVVMGFVAFIINKWIYSMFGSYIVSVIVSIAIAVIIYLILLLLTRGVDEVDLSVLPFGNKIITIAKKLHLISRI